jgi:ribosomal protein L29
MDDYRYENELFYESSSNRLLNSKEIYEKIEELNKEKFGIRFSKLSVNTEIYFELNEKRIELNIYAVKGGNKYLLKRLGN